MKDNFNSALTELKKWIRIKSLKTQPQNDAPFGENLKTMLETALGTAKNLGFEVKNYDNYIGEVIYGEGEDVDGVAVLCHLDIVPEGDLSAWDFPPYAPLEDSEYITGRGSVDNKGAAAICLYALKELKDEGFIPSKKIKLILGCDEESGWDCIEHYNKVAVMPKLGFSPDSTFPVLYAEKGIYHVKYSFDVPLGVEVLGGDRVNVVCDKATVKLNGEEKVFLGKTAHGSTPESGDNAIKKALKFLVQKNLFNEQTYEFLFNGRLFENIKDESGILTFSPNVIETKNGKIELSIDVRYPVHYTVGEIEKVLRKVGDFTVLSHKEPLYADKGGYLVQTLSKIYEKHTGEKATPATTGGGTYARALKNGVAFGPMDADDESCHIPNEKISIKKLETCFKIYKDAIKELSK